MSDEIVHPQGAVVTATEEAPSLNPYDGTNEAYAESDAKLEVEEALQEKAAEEASEPEEDKFASKFAALSRRDKELREREAEINNKLALLEEKFAALENPSEPEKEPELPLEYRLKSNPLETLKEMGLGYDKLTELALNDGKLTTDMQMQLMREELESKFGSELERLQNELAEKEKAQEEQKYEEVVNNYMNELTEFVNTDQKYELIRANDSVDLVYDVIEDYYNETGRILDMNEAADQVEAYLEEELDRIVNNTQKLQEKFGLTKAEAEKIVEAQEQKSSNDSPTLSNTHSTVVSKQGSPKTRDESLLAAASLLKWND